MLDTIQGEEEFLSHYSIVGAKIEVDRAMRGARRASIQELANVLTIQDDKDLTSESNIPNLVQNNDEGVEPVGGPGAYSGTDADPQVPDRVSSSDEGKHGKQPVAKSGATCVSGSATQGPVDPERSRHRASRILSASTSRYRTAQRITERTIA